MTAIRFPLVPLDASDLLRQTIVAEHAGTLSNVEEEVGWLDVSVKDLESMRRRESAE